MRETEKIWMNGELVDWADAKIHVGAHGLHYGTGVFEGIRCYETPRGSAVFRLTDHLKRLDDSARLLYMDLPYSVEELRGASLDLIVRNGLPECYLRPIAFFGYGELGVATAGNPVDVVIMSWPWGAYLGDEGMKNGIRAKVSSWKRVGANTIPHASKATGIYLNSMLAVVEANRAGYDEAILLTDDGFVADGSGENVFVVKDGAISTPPLSTSILPGITSATLIEIARDLGYTVAERTLIRTDLYLADEVFMTGTAAEVTPIRSVDDQEIGPPGEVTLTLQKAYLDTVRGGSGRRREGRRDAADPASSALSRRQGGGARRRGPAVRAPVARTDDRPLRRADRRAGRRAVRSRGVQRDRRPSSPRTNSWHRAGQRGDHLSALLRRVRQLLSLRGGDSGLRRRRTCDVESRPRRRRGRDHRADEGSRRRRHVRLPVRARAPDGALRTPWDRVDPGLRGGARGRVQRRTGRLARPAVCVRLLPEQAARDGRGWRRHDALAGGGGAPAEPSQPGPLVPGRRLVQPCAARVQLPLDRPPGRRRHRAAGEARPHAGAAFRGCGSLCGVAGSGGRRRPHAGGRRPPSTFLVRLRRGSRAGNRSRARDGRAA